MCCSAKIAAGAVVCVESEIRGDVTIGETIFVLHFLPFSPFSVSIFLCLVPAGARTVVHPKARIIAEAGPIIIGEGNLIEEQALIINRSALLFGSLFIYACFQSRMCLFHCSYPENILPDTDGVEPKAMTIGTNNVFEVGCGILTVSCVVWPATVLNCKDLIVFAMSYCAFEGKFDPLRTSYMVKMIVSNPSPSKKDVIQQEKP